MISETVQTLYQNNYTKLINTQYKTNITTIYGFGVFSKNGMNILSTKMHSMFIPQENEMLESYLEDKSDLESGFLSAIRTFANESYRSEINSIVLNNRMISFYDLNNGYLLGVTYDINRANRDNIEDLVQSLYLQAKEVIKKNEAKLKIFESSGNISGFEDMELELIRIFNLGYNNAECRRVVEHKKNSLEEIIRFNLSSFRGKEGAEIAKKKISELKIYRQLFPALSIDIEKYEQLLSSFYQCMEVQVREKEAEKAKNLELREFSSGLVKYAENATPKNLKELIIGLKSPIMPKDKTLSAKLGELEKLSLNFDENKILIQMDCIQVRDALKYLSNRLTYLVDAKK